MSMTSAAEAKLDARVRPQISELRSRTSYPRRRSDAGSQDAQAQAPASTVPVGVASLAAARERAEAREEMQAGESQPSPGPVPSGSRRSSKRPAPIRLTRRGRIVVGTLVGIGVAGLAALIWLAVAGQAQASGNARPGRSAGDTVARVVVKPGQTLWGIAAQVDPGADPRAIIPQIVDMNSLTSTALSVGQVLWVPRS